MRAVQTPLPVPISVPRARAGWKRASSAEPGWDAQPTGPRVGACCEEVPPNHLLGMRWELDLGSALGMAHTGLNQTQTGTPINSGKVWF